MSVIQMKLGYESTNLELSHIFIDHYLTGCPPVYPLIYIYSLRRLVSGNPITMQGIAEHFQLLSTDVVSAWRYWERVGLVAIDGSDTDMTVTFLLACAPKQLDAHKAVAANATVSSETACIDSSSSSASACVGTSVSKEAAMPTHIIPPQGRPQYTVQELAVYRSQSKDIERLFTKAAQALGKLLTYNDMNVIFGLHDWLRLPLDVIEYLLHYSTENGQRSLRYIEKCAINWAERGIEDLEEAQTYVHTYDKNYRSILGQMGKLSTFPTPAQRKLMDKWLHEMHMPLAVVLEACDRTTVSAEKPSLAYVDKVLSAWHKSGITTIAAIPKADEDFAKQQTEKKEPKSKQKPANNRFINFDQRENDYSQIEKLERQYLLERLKG